MFLHAGWFHFLSNMWILFIFGDNVEDRMGSFTFLFFYLLSGFAAGILQTMVNPSSTVPTLGASGAIAGVLGAYVVLFPAARVVTLILILFFPLIVRIPAVFFLGIWFISQLFSGVSSIATGMGGVAWWAHIGGFLFGLFLGRFFQLRPPPPAPGTFRVYDMHEDEYPWR
jgi:membrane associated rhomboid family serine protease